VGAGPSGKTVEFRGITWLRILDGRLMEGWQHSNIPEVIRTLTELSAEPEAAYDPVAR
jgi:hypothetical protein